MVEIVWGSTRKPVTSQRLAEHIGRDFRDEEGLLYIGYPVLSAAEGANSIDALWISPAHGIVIFHLIEGRESDGFEEVQDEFANNLETRLRPHKQLMKGRTLLAAPTVVTFAPLVRNLPRAEGYIITNEETISATLKEITWDNPNLYTIAHSIIQSISSIRKGRRRRTAAVQNSLGFQLKALEDSIANLDSLTCH